MSSRGAVMFLVSFLSLAALLMWFAGREPEWAAPLMLTLLGVLTAAAPQPAPQTERNHGIRRGRGAARRRLGVVAAVVGVVLLLRALGLM